MMRLFKFLVLVGLVAGCGTPAPREVSPDRNRLGILIVAGEGLNTMYDDAKISQVMFAVSTRFAESLSREIETMGTRTQIYVSRDASAKPQAYVAEQLSKYKRDGLLQIQVKRVMRNAEPGIHVTGSYYPLKWMTGPHGGESFMTEAGPTFDYPLTGSSGESGVSFSIHAKAFAQELYRRGLIGE